MPETLSSAVVNWSRQCLKHFGSRP